MAEGAWVSSNGKVYNEEQSAWEEGWSDDGKFWIVKNGQLNSTLGSWITFGDTRATAAQQDGYIRLTFPAGGLFNPAAGIRTTEYINLKNYHHWYCNVRITWGFVATAEYNCDQLYMTFNSTFGSGGQMGGVYLDSWRNKTNPYVLDGEQSCTSLGTDVNAYLGVQMRQDYSGVGSARYVDIYNMYLQN